MAKLDIFGHFQLSENTKGTDTEHISFCHTAALDLGFGATICSILLCATFITRHWYTLTIMYFARIFVYLLLNIIL